MTRQLLNTERHGKDLYRQLMTVITTMREMDPRVDVGMWGCEIVEYPIGIKVGVHIVTHPKPTTTATEMPILNVGNFDRKVLITLFTEAVKKAFPDFKTYDVMFRLSTLIHAGDMRTFRYIYSNEALKEDFLLDTSEISPLDTVAKEDVLPVTRIDEIRDVFKTVHYPKIREMLLTKGYQTPEWDDRFITDGGIDDGKYLLQLFGCNPDSDARGSGTAIIARDVKALGRYRTEVLSKELPDLLINFELCVAIMPYELLQAYTHGEQAKQLPAIPAPMQPLLKYLRSVAGTPLYAFTELGFNLYRTQDDKVWSLFTTTRLMDGNGYPLGYDNIPVIYFLLSLRHTSLADRHALVVHTLSARNRTQAQWWKLSRKWLQHKALHTIKQRVVHWISEAEFDHPALLTAVRCLHILAPRNISTISEANFKDFLEQIPGAETHLDPSALFVMMQSYFTHAAHNGLFHRVSKKQQHHWEQIREQKERDKLINYLGKHNALTPELYATIKNKRALEYYSGNGLILQRYLKLATLRKKASEIANRLTGL